ncbi:MAG: winged helix-turn-helix transcriptional regulator [Bacteroidales bacterium]
MVVETLKNQSGLNANDIAFIVGKSIPTVKRYLSSLSKSDIIEFRGAPKTGGYYLKKK